MGWQKEKIRIILVVLFEEKHKFGNNILNFDEIK